jgi:hypothetical protein
LNIYERPEGLKISIFFIASIILISLISRATRSTELRVCGVDLDDNAQALLGENRGEVVRVIARRPRNESEQTLDLAAQQVRDAHNLGADARIYFLEVERTDASSFEETLQVTGERVGKHCLLRAKSPVVANSIAAMLIHLEEVTGELPHGYFQWTEGNPVGNLFRFVFLGEGDVAPIVHEVLRRAIPDPKRRPFIHVS